MGILFIALTIIFWGTAPIIEKLALSKGDPLVGISIRSFVITVILMVILPISGKFKQLLQTDLRTVMYFSLSGVLGGLLGILTYFHVLKSSNASKVVPIVASFPLLTVLLSVIFLKEPVSVSRFVGAFLIISGIYLVK